MFERSGTAALIYFKITPFFLPLPEVLGDFSPISTVNLVELREVNLTKLWDGLHPQDWVCLESLTLRDIHTELLANNWVMVQDFLPWHWFPWRFFISLCFTSPDSLDWLVYLSNLGSNSLSSPLLWIQEEFLIILIVPIFMRTEWWLPNF